MAKKYFSGFTLVELLIILAIIAVLAALIIALFTGQIFKGTDAKRKGDLDRIKIAAEEYEKDHNCYPDSIICGVNPNAEIYPYLNNVPCDPVTGASYVYINDGLSCPAWFKVYSVLQNTQDTSVIPGIGHLGAYNYVVSSSNAPGETPIVITPSPGVTSSPAPGNNFYGCKNLACVPISWDPARPGPECDPNYQNSTCYGKCTSPGNACISWH